MLLLLQHAETERKMTSKGCQIFPQGDQDFKVN